MERPEYNYYDSKAFSVRLEDITSSEGNANILKRLRNGNYNLKCLSLVREPLLNDDYFAIREGDDLGWLGYFIGRSRLQDLRIWYLPVGEGGERVDAFMKGIAGHQPIRKLCLLDVRIGGMMVINLQRNMTDMRMYFTLRNTNTNLSDDGFASVIRALGSWSHLEELTLPNISNLGRNGCAALGTILQSGVLNLNVLSLSGNNIGDDGVAALANGFASIGSSLKELYLSNNAIGSGGLSALVAGLADCTDLGTLDLSLNDFSLAATGLGSLSDLLHRNQVNLKELCLSSCAMNDEGLQALVEGAANHCETLKLGGNQSITASGLRSLSNSMRSESCRLEELFLHDHGLNVGLNIGDDGAEVLARGLVGNKSLKRLCFDFEADRGLASAFSTALCDTSSVNDTYLSNHTLHELEIWSGQDEFGFHVWNRDDFPSDFRILLQLNKEHPQHAARCKILMRHAHLDMLPFFQWKLKFLPLALAWFERAAPCTTLSIHDNDPDLSRRVLEESDEAFQSRKLTALYEFVREMTMVVLERREELIVEAYNDEIARIEEEKKRLREELERRDRQIKQMKKLEEENKRLMALQEHWHRLSRFSMFGAPPVFRF